jgi:hypothetical protein
VHPCADVTLCDAPSVHALLRSPRHGEEVVGFVHISGMSLQLLGLLHELRGFRRAHGVRHGEHLLCAKQRGVALGDERSALQQCLTLIGVPLLMREAHHRWR